MAIKFYLENRIYSNKNYHYILCSISLNSHRVRQTLQLDIKEPQAWNPITQEFDSNSRHCQKLNKMLLTYKIRYEDYVTDKNNERKTITKSDLLDFVEEKMFQQKSSRDNLYLMFDKFIEYNRNDKSEATIKVYITLKNHLTSFNKDLDFGDIDKKFAKDFLYYLNHKKHLTNLSANKNFRTLKTFCRYCKNEKIRFPDENFTDLFKTPKPKAQTVALTKHEIKSIIQFIPYSEILRTTKDLFMFQLFTGTRFSDMQNLKPSNVNFHRNEFSFIQIKTEEEITLPLLPITKSILVKYNCQLPKINQQNYNKNIKELCKQAGINEPISKTFYYGIKRVDKEFKKYELISSHTCRRSFATALISLGFSAHETMLLTGHKDFSSFDVYIKPDEKEVWAKFTKLDFGQLIDN